MRYDCKIDDVILKILCTQRRSSYLELKRRVDSVFSKERLGRGLKGSISFETYNFHLKKLVTHNKLRREEEAPERSSRVFYYVTEEVNCYEYRKKGKIDILSKG
jgi:hypothetical protein